MNQIEQSDIRQLQYEVFDKGPEAALPCNLSDIWLAKILRDIQYLPHELDGSHSYLSAPLAIISKLLLGKNAKTQGLKENKVSFTADELFEYLQYLKIEVISEIDRRLTNSNTKPATLETIFSDRS